MRVNSTTIDNPFCFAATESPTPLVNGVSGLGLVCLVVALVGIKLKWFKQRLTFNSINEDADGASTTRGFYSTNGSSAVDGGGGGVHRNSSVSSEPQIVRATFRSFDESFEITPPTVLPRKYNKIRYGLKHSLELRVGWQSIGAC